MKRILIVLMAAGLAGCGANSVNPATPQPIAAPVAAKPTPSPPPKDVIYTLADDIVIDSTGIKINEIKTATEVKTKFSHEKTENQFIVISATFTNRGNAGISVSPSRFTVVDADGKKYEALDRATSVRGDEILFHEELNPGLSATKLIVFETPKNVKAARLQVFDGATQFMKPEKTYIELLAK